MNHLRLMGCFIGPLWLYNALQDKPLVFDQMCWTKPFFMSSANFRWPIVDGKWNWKEYSWFPRSMMRRNSSRLFPSRNRNHDSSFNGWFSRFFPEFRIPDTASNGFSNLARFFRTMWMEDDVIWEPWARKETQGEKKITSQSSLIWRTNFSQDSVTPFDNEEAVQLATWRESAPDIRCGALWFENKRLFSLPYIYIYNIHINLYLHNIYIYTCIYVYTLYEYIMVCTYTMVCTYVYV